MTPLVTVGVPVYKRLDFVAQAIRSVAAQDYPNIELIVSDNGPNGEQVAAIARANYPRPFVFRQNQTSAPIVAHFNQLVNAASGHYYILLCDDDEIAPNYVSAMVRMMEQHPQLAAAISVAENMSIDGETVSTTHDKPLPPPIMSAGEWVRGWAENRHKYISFTTNIARTADIRAAGGYPEFDGANGSDNGLLLSLCVGRSLGFSAETFYRHRIHDTSFGKSVSYKSLALASRQFLRFLDHEPRLKAYARSNPQEYAAIRAAVQRVIWITYFARWRSLYRNRMPYAQWVRGGFVLPPIPAYYRKVLAEIVASVPALDALARGVRRPGPNAS